MAQRCLERMARRDVSRSPHRSSPPRPRPRATKPPSRSLRQSIRCPPPATVLTTRGDNARPLRARPASDPRSSGARPIVPDAGEDSDRERAPCALCVCQHLPGPFRPARSPSKRGLSWPALVGIDSERYAGDTDPCFSLTSEAATYLLSLTRSEPPQSFVRRGQAVVEAAGDEPLEPSSDSGGKLGYGPSPGRRAEGSAASWRICRSIRFARPRRAVRMGRGRRVSARCYRRSTYRSRAKHRHLRRAPQR